MNTIPRAFSRRHLLSLLPPAVAGVVAFACGGNDDPDPAPPASNINGAPAGSVAPQAASTAVAPGGAAGSTQLAATPACGDDDDDPTPAQTEGPYYKRSTPERASLLEGSIGGTRLVLEGVVQRASCQPVARALLDFWQADEKGEYDNSGFKMRGHQFSDAQGRYRLETVIPGLYPGRTRHIHVKVQAPNERVLTTQLYFPNEPGNARDGIYNRALELEEYRDAANGKTGRFNFVV